MAFGMLLLVRVLVLGLGWAVPPAAAGKVPAMYVFGDSTADVGNNNYLAGSGVPRANFPHNGVDFPTSRPTGRFSNGYNGIDFLALSMGFRRSPPAFLSIANKTNRQIFKGLKGANFASAGSGVLDSTGQSIIPMSKQVEQFATLQSNITAQIAKEAADNVLSRSVFLVSTGGNDLFAFFSQNRTPTDTEKQQFIGSLVSVYKDHLKALYVLGARKLAIVDVPPIGCCPYPRSLNPYGGCVDLLNELAWELNKGVKAVMDNLSMSLQGLKYSIGSAHAVMQSIMKNPGKLGFREVAAACCGSGKFNGESGCTPNATLCDDRHHFLFWDLLHPTHATSKLVAVAIYSGSPHFAAPINFRQLVEDQC